MAFDGQSKTLKNTSPLHLGNAPDTIKVFSCYRGNTKKKKVKKFKYFFMCCPRFIE